MNDWAMTENDASTWAVLSEHGPLSTTEMAELTDWSYHAEFSRLKKLYKAGHVTRADRVKHNGSLGSTKYHVYTAVGDGPEVLPTTRKCRKITSKAVIAAAINRWCRIGKTA